MKILNPIPSSLLTLKIITAQENLPSFVLSLCIMRCEMSSFCHGTSLLQPQGLHPSFLFWTVLCTQAQGGIWGCPLQARGWTLMSLLGPFQARIFCDSMIYHRVGFFLFCFYNPFWCSLLSPCRDSQQTPNYLVKLIQTNVLDFRRPSFVLPHG